MANKVAAAALQYSKWLSRYICWIWAIYRFTVVIVSAVVPSTAEALVSTIAGMDTIMMINEGTYLVNSLGEKYIYSDRAVLKWLDKGGFKSLITKITSNAEEEGEDSGDSENG